MKRFLSVLLTVILLGLLLCACGSAELSEEAGNVQGKWAYIHDEETLILQLSANGKALFHEKEYTYDADGTHIILTDAEGNELRLRYERDGENMTVWEQTVYRYTGSGAPEGLVGVWKDEADNWSFEFTDNGTFMEDGYFEGHYSVTDKASGAVKLMYNDQFEDCTIYCSIQGDELCIEYPWPMVPAK